MGVYSCIRWGARIHADIWTRVWKVCALALNKNIVRAYAVMSESHGFRI